MAKKKIEQDYKFNPNVLEKAIIAKPLLDVMKKHPEEPVDIIIDLNLEYDGGIEKAGSKVISLLDELSKTGEISNESMPNETAINAEKNRLTRQYVFVKLSPNSIRLLILKDRKQDPAIYKIWPDFEVSSQTIKSVRTIKADAARTSFSALGEDITWAVLDSGVDFSHPHFSLHKNKHKDFHRNFTESGKAEEDEFGHGTHVAGIIAGELIKLDEK
ncbi:MAG TPA: S8 family serine peptidase, partial [Pedobacter sp.]|nr:S8 family serine peptidase [Pedobacter sp.]